MRYQDWVKESTDHAREASRLDDMHRRAYTVGELNGCLMVTHVSMWAPDFSLYVEQVGHGQLHDPLTQLSVDHLEKVLEIKHMLEDWKNGKIDELPPSTWKRM